MLLGLTAASAGSMRLLGRPVPAERVAALARVGAIVEQPRFHRYLTGRENLEVVAAARGPEARGRIDGALGRVGLADRAEERVSRYSLGMRQRLGVARALLGEPELLILDEPTNGLDPAGIHEFRAMIRGLVDEGRTVLLSSHLLDEVDRLCDAAAIVDRGRVVAQGSLGELRGARQTILIGAGDAARAQTLAAAHPAVLSAATTPDGIRITLVPGRPATAERAAADLNRRLVAAGVAVHRLEPAGASLEERFLQITSRLGVAA
jgi:ABC-2 type transport system ATP-binding protein